MLAYILINVSWPLKNCSDKLWTKMQAWQVFFRVKFWPKCRFFMYENVDLQNNLFLFRRGFSWRDGRSSSWICTGSCKSGIVVEASACSHGFLESFFTKPFISKSGRRFVCVFCRYIWMWFHSTRCYKIMFNTVNAQLFVVIRTRTRSNFQPLWCDLSRDSCTATQHLKSFSCHISFQNHIIFPFYYDQ